VAFGDDEDALIHAARKALDDLLGASGSGEEGASPNDNI
jgi:hypothetical protein